MSKRAVVSLLLMMGLTAPSVARADVITLDAGQLHSTNYLAGQTGFGRGFGFLADEMFTLSAVGFDLGVGVANGTLYQYEVFGSTNGHAADGGLLASSGAFTLAAGTGYQDRALAFTFNLGSFYVVNFSRVDNGNLGSNIGAHYSLESSLLLPHDYGILSMVDGLEGANGEFVNGFLPHARLTFDPVPVPEPTSLTLLGAGLAVLARRRWRKR